MHSQAMRISKHIAGVYTIYLKTIVQISKLDIKKKKPSKHHNIMHFP